MMAAVVPPWPAFAQEPYPSRPIRLVIPSVPAGVHDVIGRLWAERVKPILGTIVIDNRGGGGGVIGANDVAHSKPDATASCSAAPPRRCCLQPRWRSRPTIR
jgi:tripartite-type tricarboxylate transporter receptor subunit TctC